MKKSLKQLSSKAGFSLVELMVVVAIIGVLATIGIPKYRNFRMKAFETEAKSHLAGIYTAQTAFFIEYSGYHHSLKVIGYAPLGKNRYNAGFVAPSSSVPSNAPVEATYINTKIICSGTYASVGSMNDPNCSIDIPVPDIGNTPGIIPVIGTNSYLATAMADIETLQTIAHYTENSFINVALQSLISIDQVNASSTTTIKEVDAWAIDEKKSMTRRKGFNYPTPTWPGMGTGG